MNFDDIYDELSYLKSRSLWFLKGFDAQKVWREKTGKEVDDYIKNDEAYVATKKQVEFVISKIMRYAPSTILEVGCGYGRILKELEPLAFNRIVGVDFSPEMLAEGRERELSDKVELVHADASNLPFKNDEFELVFTSGVLMHVPPEKVMAVMKEMARVSQKTILNFESISITDFARFGHDYKTLYSKLGIKVTDFAFLPPECNGKGDKQVLVTVEKLLK